MIAELPNEVSEPEHVVEVILHGGPSWRVLAGNCAELRFCRLGHQTRAEDLHPFGAR